DIAISATSWGAFSDTGKVYIYYGGDTISTIPYNTLIGDEVTNIGDINGDERTEFAILSLQQGTHIYFSLDSVEAFIGGNFSSGNINNDEFGDFIIGNTDYRNSSGVMVGGAFVYLGSENLDSVYEFKLEGENQWGEFSKTMSTADINGDGFDELFVLAPGYPDYQNPLGKVYIYSYKNIVDVENDKKNLLINFNLNQNYPNPFNPETVISYRLSVTGFISIKVYDVLGREISTIINEEKPPGDYKIEFDASKYNLSSGVYFCELTIKGDASSINGVESQRIKMLYIK